MCDRRHGVWSGQKEERLALTRSPRLGGEEGLGVLEDRCRGEPCTSGDCSRYHRTIQAPFVSILRTVSEGLPSISGAPPGMIIGRSPRCRSIEPAGEDQRPPRWPRGSTAGDRRAGGGPQADPDRMRPKRPTSRSREFALLLSRPTRRMVAPRSVLAQSLIRGKQETCSLCANRLAGRAWSGDHRAVRVKPGLRDHGKALPQPL